VDPDIFQLGLAALEQGFLPERKSPLNRLGVELGVVVEPVYFTVMALIRALAASRAELGAGRVR
jgi:hypothetical protein